MTLFRLPALAQDFSGAAQKKPEITGIIAGAFDLCHPGHLLAFAQAKSMCDKLIVGLHTNPKFDRPEKNMPMESVFERWMRLKNCAHVDEIIPYDTERDWRNILHTVAWDVRFLDEEYKGKTFTGHDIRPDNIIYLPRQHDFSSSNLRKKLDGPK